MRKATENRRSDQPSDGNVQREDPSVSFLDGHPSPGFAIRAIPWRSQTRQTQPRTVSSTQNRNGIKSIGLDRTKLNTPGPALSSASAEPKNEDYVALAYKLQNSDGSFSTNWFAGSGSGGDINPKLNTTGHTLEWLLVSLPDDQLNDPRLVKAAQCLTALMWNYRDRAWEIGPRGHALHALALVDERVFGGTPGERKVELAQARDDQAGPIAGGPQFNASESRTPAEAVPRTGLFGRGRR